MGAKQQNGPAQSGGRIMSLLMEDMHMRRYDFSPLFRSSVGFDHLANIMDQLSSVDSDNGFPPYNIERLGEHEYRITMAVAGFSIDDLDIEVKESTLSVKGDKKTEIKEREYLHRGIAARNFERRYRLADHVEVTGATLENGFLHIDLKREIPEAMKPRTIKIGKPAQNGNGAPLPGGSQNVQITA
jgi:molecular chaperone IbpA